MKYILYSLLLCFSPILLAAKNTTFKMVDKNLGVYNEDYKIDSDTQRFSVLAHTQSDLSQAADFYSFEASYALKIQTFWLESFLSQTTATFSALFADQDSTVDNTIPSDASEKMLSAGLGLGYRFNIIQELLGGEKWYETVQTYLTYNLMSESYSGENFQGFGLRADYGVHYRSDHRTHYGMRLSYHVASLVRPVATEGETRSDRSLTSAVLSLALEYGIYF